MSKSMTYDKLIKSSETFDQYQETVLSGLDEKSWRKALKKNNSKSYQVYLTQFPQGIYVTKAKEKFSKLFDEELWNSVKDKNDLNHYHIYLNKLPTGLHRGEALQEIEKIIENKSWNKAKSLNTLDGYKAYLDECFKGVHNGLHEQEAIEFVEQIQDTINWNKAKKLNTLSSYQGYLDKSAQGLYRQEALNAIETIKYMIQKEKEDKERENERRKRNEELRRQKYELDRKRHEYEKRSKMVMLVISSIVGLVIFGYIIIWIFGWLGDLYGIVSEYTSRYKIRVFLGSLVMLLGIPALFIPYHEQDGEIFVSFFLLSLGLLIILSGTNMTDFKWFLGVVSMLSFIVIAIIANDKNK